MRYRHQIILERSDVELLHQYADDFDFMYMDEDSFVFNEYELTDWLNYQLRRYANDKPIKWDRTPNVEAADLMNEICETAEGWCYNFDFEFEEEMKYV